MRDEVLIVWEKCVRFDSRLATIYSIPLQQKEFSGQWMKEEQRRDDKLRTREYIKVTYTNKYKNWTSYNQKKYSLLDCYFPYFGETS